MVLLVKKIEGKKTFNLKLKLSINFHKIYVIKVIYSFLIHEL